MRRVAPLALPILVVATLSACGGTSSTGSAPSEQKASAAGGADKVTVYSADGLGDWYKKEFAAFKTATGISVDYVEAGSGEVVSRVAKEKSNPQADVLVTLPPFVQQAKASGLLVKNALDTTGIPASKRDKDGTWVPLVDNYFTMIRKTGQNPAPTTWADLTDARFAQKLQYSTPGQSGDGTAMLALLQTSMGKDKARSYLASLQKNNVGPSSSTGKLGPKVSKGELLVANSDLQMALLAIKDDKVAYETFFPKGADGKAATIALPYAMGVVDGAPHREAAVKLANFLLSKQVQESVPEAAMGLPVREDVTATGAAMSTLTAATKDVTVLPVDWDAFYASLPADLAAYKKATNQ